MKNKIAIYKNLANRLLKISQTIEDFQFIIKNEKELTRFDCEKLDELTLHGKSMMSSFLQNVYVGNLTTPAIVAIAKVENEYVAWSLLQFNKFEKEYVKSIDVFVSPKYRRLNLGSKLLHMVKEKSNSINEIEGLPVNTEPVVGAWDEASRSFYKKHKLKGDIESPKTFESSKELSKYKSELSEVDRLFEGL